MGGMEAPGTLVGTRFPSVNVPVCVFTSVTKCVLQSAHSGGERRCVRATPCMDETPSMKETPCVDETPGTSETPCVSGVVTSVPKCVLPSTPCEEEAPRVKEAVCVSERVCVSETLCVSGTTCAREMARVSEARCVSGTACVRSLCVREMTVGMREHAAAPPSVNVMEWCVSVVTRRCVCAWN